MIVTCPGCSSKYVVQTETIGSGKLVRCAVCGTVWQQSPVDEKALKRKQLLNVVGWTFFYAVVFTSVALLFLGKDFVIDKWSASESFYEYVGMHNNDVKNDTFVLDNVSYFFVRKNGDLYIGIRGELSNTASEVKTVPTITITLRNDPEVESEPFKKIWVHKLQYQKLLPAQKVLFETKLQRVSSDNLLCDIKLNFR
jgi:predicted Zn finger-like uncharacterized protein